MLTKEILKTKLIDDATPFGGVSYSGETVKDFIDETKINPNSLDESNKALQECGIAEIKQ